MIKPQEHYYSDNPDIGHPDVRTRLRDAYYFFLGNGFIQAAVQISPSREGTPLGLLIMDPDEFAEKRNTLTFIMDAGLEKTMIRLYSKQFVDNPNPVMLEAGWCSDCAFPTVQVQWNTERFRVAESFYCPDLKYPSLIRKVCIHNPTDTLVLAGFQTSVLGHTLDLQLSFPPNETKILFLAYTLDPVEKRIRLEKLSPDKVSGNAKRYWHNTAQASFGSAILDHYFRASSYQLPAVISKSGKVDGSIWQYNREWVRDQSMIAVGLTMSGHHRLAQRILNRLFDQFVTPDGDTVDSSEKRNSEDVELDQNGELLYALSQYIFWSGDKKIIKRHWDKIAATAEFPLRKTFRHAPSGLVFNQREYWERHRLHGIQKGMELAHQLFVSMGLEAAACLAREIGNESKAAFWDEESRRIKNTMLSDPRYKLTDGECFIKRRGIRGSIQYTITPSKDAELPKKSPLLYEKIHHLNPDASAALPVAFGFIPPDAGLSIHTLQNLESLWNQNWTIGGYGRYHFTSEPDSAGPWPFPSLFIARAYMEMEEDEKVWRILNWLNTLAGAKSGSWFEFYGSRISPPYPQVGIPPWTWAEMIILLVHHLIGLRPGEDGILLKPRLLTGIQRIQASFPLRDHRIHLDICRSSDGSGNFRSDGHIVQSAADTAHIAYPASDIHVKAAVP